MKQIFHFLVFLSILLLCTQCISLEKRKNDESALIQMSNEFAAPAIKYHPETWFHFNGNNISKEGITLDLEAIKYAGIQGIHLFSKNGRPYPGVEQIKILSPEWEEMVRHTADECKRLGLKFTMQNCPGWSMTGGPWVPVEEAQREIVESVYRIKGGSKFDEQLKLDEAYLRPDYDYKDVHILAFPTPEGDDMEVHIPSKIETNNTLIPWDDIFNPDVVLDVTSRNISENLKAYVETGIAKVNGEDTWVKVKFDQPLTVRSLKMSPIRDMIFDRQYPRVDLEIKIQAVENGKRNVITQLKIPNANWSDRQLDVTLAIPETSSDEFVISFVGEHSLLPADIHLSAKPRLHNHEAKAAKALRSLEKDIESNYTENCVINPENIINLSDKMDESGNLSWNAPEGNWTVVRFGHVNMRRTNNPAMPESTGWECSKLDKVAIENHLRNGMIGKMIKDGGPIGDGKLAGLLIDSWESFIPTWTMHSEAMFKEFEQRRGYSMKLYLPATVGYIVESPEVSTKFLRDLRQTMDEVYIDNFFEHFATIAHEMGAEVYTEGAGGEVLPVDPMRYYGVSDNPMTEFWYPKAPSNQNEYAKPVFSAASATHLYNKPFLAAEACTQKGVNWSEHPFDVKYLIDYNFTKGINHLVFHTFSHTPQKEIFPGSSFAGSIGFPFVRQQTWWKYMPDFIDYLARCQYVLQQGEYAADVLWYYGDHYERPPFDLDYFPKGYRFDYLNAEIMQEKLSLKEGKINVEDAGDYRLILLRESKDMLLSTAQKLKELVLQGAVIIGDKPLDSPSLMDDEKDLKELKTIANQLWGNTENGVKLVGKGKVYWGQSLDQVLKAESITPDVIVAEELPISWIHRKTADADIYFVSSTSDHTLDVSLSFRVKDVSPQLWNAFTGNVEEAKVWSKEKERTNVALSFPPSGSAIVVFSKEKKEPFATKVTYNHQIILDSRQAWFRQHKANELLPSICFNKGEVMVSHAGAYTFTKSNNSIETQKIELLKNIYNENWELSFTDGWDVSANYHMAELVSLTKLDNDAMRHYSGTVVYTKEIERPEEGERYLLDLGQVHNIAEVWCNGKKVGTRWAPPYSFDLSDKLTESKNKLEIKVTNTWRNQLIFDNTRAKEAKKTWTTNPPNKMDTELDLSGLVGPVVLWSLQ